MAVFVIFAVITGVIVYLAMLQGKIKRQIEENRRHDDDTIWPPGTGPDFPSTGTGINVPPPDHSTGSHDGGAHHHGGDAGGHTDAGGSFGGDGGSGGHH